MTAAIASRLLISSDDEDDYNLSPDMRILKSPRRLGLNPFDLRSVSFFICLIFYL